MNKPGFTLIELLVVVLITGVLAAVALPQYQKAVNKSRAMQAIAVLTTAYKAQQVYFMANGNYSASLEDLDVDLPPWKSKSGNDYFYSWGYCGNDPRGGNTACNIKYSFGWLIIRAVPASQKLVCVHSGSDHPAEREEFCKSLGFQLIDNLYIINL